MSINIHTLDMKELSALEEFRKELLSAKFLNPEKKTPSSQQIRRKLAAIRRKVYSGGKLTAAERQFLKKYAPALYSQLIAIERENERIERERKRQEFQNKAEEMEAKELKEAALTYTKQVQEKELLEEKLLKKEEEEKDTEQKKWEKELRQTKGRAVYQSVFYAQNHGFDSANFFPPSDFGKV